MKRKILLLLMLLITLVLMGCLAREAPERAVVSQEYIAPVMVTPSPTMAPTPEPERTPRPNHENFASTLDERVEVEGERPWFYDESLSREKNIHNFLREEAGLSEAAVCGVLANMAYETGWTFDPEASNPHSYGLCQWLGRRLDKLVSWCGENGEDYTTIEGQCRFLIWELQNDDPYGTWDELQAVEDSTDGAYRAGWYFCYWFERPADLANQARYRGYEAVRYFNEGV